MSTPHLSLDGAHVPGAFAVVRYLHAHLREPDVASSGAYAQTVRFLLRDVCAAVIAARPDSTEAWSAQLVLPTASPMHAFASTQRARRRPAPLLAEPAPTARLVLREGELAGVLAVNHFFIDLFEAVSGGDCTTYSATLEAIIDDLLSAVDRRLRSDVPR